MPSTRHSKPTYGPCRISHVGKRSQTVPPRQDSISGSSSNRNFDRVIAVHKLSPQAQDASEQHCAATKMSHLFPWSPMPTEPLSWFHHFWYSWLNPCGACCRCGPLTANRAHSFGPRCKQNSLCEDLVFLCWCQRVFDRVVVGTTVRKSCCSSMHGTLNSHMSHGVSTQKSWEDFQVHLEPWVGLTCLQRQR